MAAYRATCNGSLMWFLDEKLRGFLFALMVAFSFKIQASVDLSPSHNAHLTGDLSEKLTAIENEVRLLKKEIKEKTRVYHSIKNGASSPLYAWETEAKVEKKRKKLIPYLKIDIKEKLKQLAALENQLEETRYDLDLAKVDVLHLGTLAEKPVSSTQMFQCSTLPGDPLVSQMTLIQGFGSQVDPSTGLKWNSSGWWITQMSGPVKSCSKGVVAFDGKVQGRGRVVMIDHGDATLSLYANLHESFEAFAKGTKIESGQLIGDAKEKFYFEIRKKGIPVDPKAVLKVDQLAKFKE